MNSNNYKLNMASIIFLGLITVLLVVLKAVNLIDLAWIWVFSPLWGPLAFYALVVVSTFLAIFLYEAIAGIVERTLGE